MPKNQKPSKTNPKKSRAKPVTLLLTGFDAFADMKYNPAQLVVEAFPDILKSRPREQSKVAKEIYIRRQVLPTAGVKGWKTLKKALDSLMEEAEGPIIVIMLGLAQDRKSLSVERFAMNFKDYGAPDNNKETRLDETIEAKAPQLLRTNLDLPHLATLMNAAGYPCHVSNHAGTFICNELYFRALNYKREFTEIDSVLFMHLPLEKVFAKAAQRAKNKNTPENLAETLRGIGKAGKSRQIQLLRDAIVEATENIAHEIVNHTLTRRK